MNIQDVYAADALLKPYLFKTPLIFSHLLHKKSKKQVWLKLETQQPTGSFKPRPAFHSILKHLDDARKCVEKVILVEEEDIVNATRFMLEQHKLVVEPGGAVGIAALLRGQVTTTHCVCIISGGNLQVWKE